MERPGFEFEKLEVYQLTLRLMPLVAEITAQLPVGYADLRNHVRRSERSIRLNVAEGAGRNRPGGKAERFRTARGSANECAAGLDPLPPHHLHAYEAGAVLGASEGTLTVSVGRVRGPAFPGGRSNAPARPPRSHAFGNSRTRLTPGGHGHERDFAVSVSVGRVLYLRTGGAGRVGRGLGFSAMRRRTSWTARSSCGSRPWITAMGSCSTSMSGSTP
jgi:hypothetical protein